MTATANTINSAINSVGYSNAAVKEVIGPPDLFQRKMHYRNNRLLIEIVHDKRCLDKSVGQTKNGLECSLVKQGLIRLDNWP